MTTEFPGEVARAAAVLVQADGRIVAAGQACAAAGCDMVIVRYLSDGSLDTSFSANGKARVNFGEFDAAVAVAGQAGGRILVAGVSGYTHSTFAVARLRANGELDSNFGGDGRRRIDFPGGFEAASGVDIMGDGRIVVGGTVRTFGDDSALGVARLLHDGQFDRSFGGNGRTVINPTRFSDTAYDVGFRHDPLDLGRGGIFVAGCTECNVGDNDMLIVQLRRDGKPGRFAGDGFKRIDVFGETEVATDISFVGRSIFVAGTVDRQIVVARLSDVGSLDPDFGDHGVALSGGGDEFGQALGIDRAGRILVVGSTFPGSDDSFAIAYRFTHDGSPDLNFGDQGRLQGILSSDDLSSGATVAVQPDDRIVVAGWVGPTFEQSDFTVARLLPN